jgi:hypothetical protein
MAGLGKSEKDVGASKQGRPIRERARSNGQIIENGVSLKEKFLLDDSSKEKVDFDLVDALPKPPPLRPDNPDIHIPIVNFRESSHQEIISRTISKLSDQDLTSSKTLATSLQSKKKRGSYDVLDGLQKILVDNDSEIDIFEMLSKEPHKRTPISDESNQNDRKEHYTESLTEVVKKDNRRKGSVIDFILKNHVDLKSQDEPTTHIVNSKSATPNESNHLSNLVKSFSNLQLQKTLFKSNEQISRKVDEIFSGHLKTIVVNNSEDYLVRVNENDLFISEGNDFEYYY